MRVAIIARHLGLPVGLGTYARNLLLALDRCAADHEYIVCAPSWNEIPSLGPRFRISRWALPRGSRAIDTSWDLTLPAAVARRASVDLVHYLYTAYPAVAPRRPVVVNILDAIGWALPGYRLPIPYRWLERRAARRADLVLTLSEHSRADLARFLGIGADRVRVTPLGAPPLDLQAKPKKPYFLFVGGTEKRKNLRTVLAAFDSLDDYELLVVGPLAKSAIHDAWVQRPRVRSVGAVTDEELGELYRGATALVFPSRYEGFGLPVLEAMARRTPVIAANCTSIPEVAGDAALLVSPDDVDGLSAAMNRVATDADLSAALVERGAAVAQRFSWDETARLTIEAYRAALD